MAIEVTYDGNKPWGDYSPYVSTEYSPVMYGDVWTQGRIVLLEGTITKAMLIPYGGSLNFPTLEDARDAIINTFNDNNKVLSVVDLGGASLSPLQLPHVFVDSISFPSGQLGQVLKYSIALKTYEGLAGGVMSGSLGAGDATGIFDPVDKFDVQVNENATATITHTVSARGVFPKPSPPNTPPQNSAAPQAMANAIDWVNDRINIGSTRVVPGWGLENYKYVLLDETEQINQFTQFFSKTRVYLIDGLAYSWAPTPGGPPPDCDDADYCLFAEWVDPSCPGPDGCAIGSWYTHGTSTNDRVDVRAPLNCFTVGQQICVHDLQAATQYSTTIDAIVDGVCPFWNVGTPNCQEIQFVLPQGITVPTGQDIKVCASDCGSGGGTTTTAALPPNQSPPGTPYVRYNASLNTGIHQELSSIDIIGEIKGGINTSMADLRAMGGVTELDLRDKADDMFWEQQERTFQLPDNWKEGREDSSWHPQCENYTLEEDINTKTIRAKATFVAGYALYVQYGEPGGRETAPIDGEFVYEISVDVDFLTGVISLDIDGQIEAKGTVKERNAWIDMFLDGTIQTVLGRWPTLPLLPSNQLDVKEFLYQRVHGDHLVDTKAHKQICDNLWTIYAGGNPGAPSTTTGGGGGGGTTTSGGGGGGELSNFCGNEVNNNPTSFSMTRNIKKGTLSLSGSFNDEDMSSKLASSDWEVTTKTQVPFTKANASGKTGTNGYWSIQSFDFCTRKKVSVEGSRTFREDDDTPTADLESAMRADIEGFKNAIAETWGSMLLGSDYTTSENVSIGNKDSMTSSFSEERSLSIKEKPLIDINLVELLTDPDQLLP